MSCTNLEADAPKELTVVPAKSNFNAELSPISYVNITKHKRLCFT